MLEWDERVKEHFFFPPTARIAIDDFYSRIHENDRAPTREAIDVSIRSRTPYDIVYRTVHPATGEVKWVRALGGTDYASDGTPVHFDGVTVDVSAQKRDQQRLSDLNDQLREQDRLKDQFIATLSHELRNPLAPIRAAAQVIASPIHLIALTGWGQDSDRLRALEAGFDLHLTKPVDPEYLEVLVSSIHAAAPP